MTQMDSESIIGSSSSTTTSTVNNVNNQTPRLIQQYNWYYDKSELKRTPSILDNISYERERMYRNEGARFILNVGSQMKLRYDTLATGVVYFHRFYMQHSFKVFPSYVTAACCLFLAGKAEETPKKCKDIIKIARTLLDDQQFSTFGEDPREEVLTLERIVLQTIRFDLQVEHPYKYLVNYAKCFKGNKDHIQEVLQMAWTFTNDSLCTTICLQWEPEIVAIAMIFLASKIRYEISDWEGRLPHQKHWWDMYVENLRVELLEDICHQVLDLYSKPNEESSIRSPPLTSSPQTPVHSTGGRSGESGSLTPIKPSFPPPPPPPLPSAPTATIQSMGQFRPSVLLSSNPQTLNATSIQVAPGPSTTNTIPTANLPPTLPPLPPHQWDANMASFYQKYNLVPLVPGMGKAPTINQVHMVPPPPPPPPGIAALGIAPIPGRLPVQPPIPPPPFVPGVNQHQP